MPTQADEYSHVALQVRAAAAGTTKLPATELNEAVDHAWRDVVMA